MEYKNTLIAWNKKGKVEVGEYPDCNKWSVNYSMTAGGCYAVVKNYSEDQRVINLFSNFHSLVVRDGIDPQQAHNEFLKIDEYRKAICLDIEGAE